MATGAGENLFVDTNILVYMTVASAPLHAQAKDALAMHRKIGKDFWISRWSRFYKRLSSSSRIFRISPI